MKESKLIDTINLENGLKILFYDGSKKIIGDRWQIIVTAKIQIVTTQIHFTRMDRKKRLEIIKEVGEQIYYEKEIIQNFVGEKQKEKTIKDLYESFLKNTRLYFSHCQFAERFVLKTYADSLEKHKWVNS